MNKKQFGRILGLYFGLRLLYFIVGAVSDTFLTYAPSFAYGPQKLSLYHMPRWLYSWANFDGVHYLIIAEKGYIGTGLIQAFFPFYPAITSLVNFFIKNTIVSGLLVSNLSFLGVLILLFVVIKNKFSEQVAWWSLLSLCFFPTSFFFVAVYSESLFLLLVLLALYFKEKKQWWLMSLAIIGVSATRIVGVFLVPAIMADLLFGKSFKLKVAQKNLVKHMGVLLILVLGSLGLFGYMLYLWYAFGDPLYFWHVQSEFGGGREESIVLLPQVIWRYVKIFMTVPFDLRWPSYVQEFIFGLLPLLVILYAWLKQRVLPHSWALFSVSALLLPTFTGTFSSMPRYALSAFPLFLLLGIAYNRYPKLRWTLAVLLGLALFNLVLFIQGYWVA